MSTPVIAIIIIAIVVILFATMFIATAKDKAKAFSKSLIILFLMAGVISILGYVIKYTPAKDIIEKIVSIFS